VLGVEVVVGVGGVVLAEHGECVEDAHPAKQVGAPTLGERGVHLTEPRVIDHNAGQRGAR
jgi:hypothetical protein